MPHTPAVAPLPTATTQHTHAYGPAPQLFTGKEHDA